MEPIKYDALSTTNEALDALISGARDNCPGLPIGRISVFSGEGSTPSVLATVCIFKALAGSREALAIDFAEDFSHEAIGGPYQEMVSVLQTRCPVLASKMAVVAPKRSLLILNRPDRALYNEDFSWAGFLKDLRKVLQERESILLIILPPLSEIEVDRTWRSPSSLWANIEDREDGVYATIRKSMVSDSMGRTERILA